MNFNLVGHIFSKTWCHVKAQGQSRPYRRKHDNMPLLQSHLIPLR